MNKTKQHNKDMEQLLIKRDALLAGAKIIVSEKDYDALIDLGDDRLDNMVSVWNENRAGILDALVAWIK